MIYTDAEVLKELAQKLKARYPNVIGYIDTSKIFFAFKGGDDLPDWFEYEVLGNQNQWTKFTDVSFFEAKEYCIAITYDFYKKADGPLLEWTLLDLLYSCSEKMDGKLRRKDLHEHSRILLTLNDLDIPILWRNYTNIPPLLDNETVSFQLEENDIL